MNRTQLIILGLIAFFISLENVLDYLLNISTILKPYRALMILFVIHTMCYSGRRGFMLSKNNSLLAALFLLSTFIVIGRSFFAEVSFENAISIGALILINFVFYLAVCNLTMSRRDVISLCYCFLCGLALNLVVDEAWLNEGRYSGFFSNPNSLGFSSLIAVVLVAFLTKTARSILIKLLLVSSMLLWLFFINESGSRTAFYLVILLFCFILFFMLVRSRYGMVIVVVVGILGSISFLAGLPIINGSFVSVKINALERERYKAKVDDENERIILAKASMDAFYETNFVGLGLGQFQFIENFYPLISKYNSEIALDRLRKNEGLSAHGTLWTVIAEMGFLGLLCFVIFLVKLLVKLLRSFMARQEYAEFDLLLFIVLFFIALRMLFSCRKFFGSFCPLSCVSS